MDALQALHSFWSGFGLPAYDETSVPDNAVLPYVTYEVSKDDFGNPLTQSASLWYRSSSWADITAKMFEISDFITRGGRMIKYDKGAMWIVKGTPFAQRLEEASDETIRRFVLNVLVEFLD